MDDLIAFYRRTMAAQRLAERNGFVDTAAAFKRVAETVLLEFGGDINVIVCLMPRPVLPSVGALRIEHQARL